MSDKKLDKTTQVVREAMRLTAKDVQAPKAVRDGLVKKKTEKEKAPEIDIAQLKIGQKVHYIPFEGCDKRLYQNGMVKEIPEHTVTQVRVVFNCAGEWKNFKNYTSQLTSLSELRLGWHFQEIEDVNEDDEI